MNTNRKFFEEAMAIPDAVERSEALNDLAFDAEQFALAGRREDALELFELLSTLDRNDDLLFPAIESAEKHLVSLGVRQPPSIEDAISGLRTGFANLGEAGCLLSMAKSLVREQKKYGDQVWVVAMRLLTEAEKITPLSGKDLRFRSEVAQRARSAT